MAIGEPVPMLDSVARVTGATEYLVNLRLPDMLVGKIVRSTVPHARLVRVDASKAARVPGVVAILTGADLEKKPFGLAVKDQYVLAVERVRYVGEPVAAIAAENADAAEEAAALVEVEYEELPAVYDAMEAIQPGAPVLHEQFPKNIYRHAKMRHGDIDAGFAQADEIFEDTFTSPAAQHVSLEPHGAVAQWNADRLTLWTGVQAPFGLARMLGELFGTGPQSVRVIVPTLGGGYGGKGSTGPAPIAAALARHTDGRPVKLVLSRAEEFVTVIKHAATVKIKTGVKRDGTFVARQVSVYWRGGAYGDASANLVGAGMLRSIGPYRIPVVWVDSYGVYANVPPAGSFRGAMTSQGVWAYESQMDMIARRMGWDPLEFRMKNLVQDGDEWATGEKMHDVHFVECLQAVSEAIESPAAPTLSEKDKVGRGFAVMMKNTIPASKSQAKLRLAADGRLTLLTSTVEMGQGSHTALAQITSDAVGTPLSQIEVIGPDTARTPFDMTTSASRSTTMMGNAIRAAADDLKRKLIGLAAQTFEAPPDQLHTEDGKIVSPAHEAVSFADILKRNNIDSMEAFGEYATNLGVDPETGQGVSTPHWHQGAGAAEVVVDVETGKVTLRRYRSASFAGEIVNPRLAELQNDGNVIYGLGPTLFEEMVFEDGQVVNQNLSDYMIPSFRDIPRELEGTTLEEEGVEPFGIGEMTLPPVSPAIANAIEDAIGVRIADLPITAERVLRALRARQAQSHDTQAAKRA